MKYLLLLLLSVNCCLAQVKIDIRKASFDTISNRFVYEVVFKNVSKQHKLLLDIEEDIEAEQLPFPVSNHQLNFALKSPFPQNNVNFYSNDTIIDEFVLYGHHQLPVSQRILLTKKGDYIKCYTTSYFGKEVGRMLGERRKFEVELLLVYNLGLVRKHVASKKVTIQYTGVSPLFSSPK